MKRLLFIGLSLSGLVCLGLLAVWILPIWLLPEKKPLDRSLEGLEGDVARGAYVARLSACITCHTDIQGGGAVLAGGAAIKTPFGTFYAPNITPDPEAGIGSWSLPDFARALTEGISPDGRHYFPAFPYPFFERLSDQDIVDLWAAVQSVPAVKNSAPDHDLPIPFGAGLAARVWQALFLSPPTAPRMEGTAADRERGAYLAEGPAHCGACHTPRNLFGARDTTRRFRGGEASSGEKAPAITAEALKRRNWTEKNLVYALRTGLMPDGDSFGGAMARVVNGGTRFWSNKDLEALAGYLLAE